MTEKLINPTERPVPEVKATPRRQFSAEEKLRILEEADACTEPGEIEATFNTLEDLALCLAASGVHVNGTVGK